jgi:hypothetical protein
MTAAELDRAPPWRELAAGNHDAYLVAGELPLSPRRCSALMPWSTASSHLVRQFGGRTAAGSRAWLVVESIAGIITFAWPS